MTTSTAGRLVVFEGVPGSGRTALSIAYCRYLKDKGHKAVQVRLPGGTDFAEEIRRISHDPKAGGISATTRELLLAAARRDTLEKLIQPKLKEGVSVVCDGFLHPSEWIMGAGQTCNSIRAFSMAGSYVDACIMTDINYTTFRDRNPDSLMPANEFGQLRTSIKAYARHLGNAVTGVVDGGVSVAEQLDETVKLLRALRF